MPPDVAAASILKAIRGNWTETALGWQASWMVRVNRIAPWFVNWMLARRVKQLYAEAN